MTTFNVNVDFKGLDHRQMQEIQSHFHNLKETIMVAQSQTAQELRDVNTKFQKASAEIVAQVKALTDALANAPTDTTPEVQSAVDDLKATAQVLDDLNPDAPPVEPPVV